MANESYLNSHDDRIDGLGQKLDSEDRRIVPGNPDGDRRSTGTVGDVILKSKLRPFNLEPLRLDSKNILSQKVAQTLGPMEVFRWTGMTIRDMWSW